MINPQPAAFPPGSDQPSGRTDSLKSTIDGRLLTYFTPDSLTELLDRYRATTIANVPTLGADPTALALALARPASARSADGEVDTRQAERFCAAICQKKNWKTPDEFSDLAAEISPHLTARARNEIVFSGGPTATRSEHIYAPFSAIPPLMQSLSDGLSNHLSGVDATLRAAIVGFFCVHVHPFMDGNGRWSRLVAFSTSIEDGIGMARAMCNVSFQNLLKRELGEIIWPDSRRQGLRKYLEASLMFEQEFSHGYVGSKLERSINALHELSQRAASRTGYRQLAQSAFGIGRIDFARLKNELGLSDRALQGRLAQVGIERDTPVPNADLKTDGIMYSLQRMILNVGHEVVTRNFK